MPGTLPRAILFIMSILSILSIMQDTYDANGGKAVPPGRLYDADGNRAVRTRSGQTTVYFAGAWEDTLGVAARKLSSFNGQIIAQRTGSATPAYLHGDHLGSVAVTSDHSGGAVQRQFFDPWGAIKQGGTPGVTTNVTGQRRDDTGLLFYNARYYDPVIGRFLSADTIVPGAGRLTLTPSDATAAKAWGAGGGGPLNPQELNRYAYALNNPLRYTDPTGHCIGWIWGAADCQFIGGDTSRWDYAGALNSVQTGLDVLGMIPVAREAADGANALIAAARGDLAGAALSAAAMVPLAGGGATAGKLAAKYGDAAVEMVAADSLYFSQKGISWTTKSGVPLDDLSQDIASGWRGAPLRVLEQGDALVSLDNRRLTAAKLIGVEVPIQRVSLSDPLIRRTWAERDGIQSSILIRGTNMRVDKQGRIQGQ